MFSPTIFDKFILAFCILIFEISAAPQLNSKQAESEILAHDTVFNKDIVHFPKDQNSIRKHFSSYQRDAKPWFGIPVLNPNKQITFPDDFPGLNRDMSRKQLLCPAVAENEVNNYFYDPNTGKCYAQGSTEPCDNAPYMVFMKDPLDEYNGLGKCICKPEPSLETPLVYHQKSGQCFALYTQANCPAKQWLIYDEEYKQPVCDINPCSSRDGRKNVVYFNGGCVEARGERGSCPQGSVVGFDNRELTPSCVLDSTYYATGAIPGVRKKCPKGTIPSFNGKCLRSFLW